MVIPERLKLQPVSNKLFDEMSALCDAIERELESGKSAESLLQRWHFHARCRCDPDEFQTYWKAVSKEVFVREALSPVPSFDENAMYSETRAVLDAVSTAAVPESEIGYYLRWLECSFRAATLVT